MDRFKQRAQQAQSLDKSKTTSNDAKKSQLDQVKVSCEKYGVLSTTNFCTIFIKALLANPNSLMNRSKSLAAKKNAQHEVPLKKPIGQ